MYENRNQPPISRRLFRRRMAVHVLVAMALFFGTIAIGTLGFVTLEGVDWLHGMVNSTMLVSGLGAAEMPQRTGGRLFASLYALWSGFVFVAMSGIVIAPILHRLLHLFHAEDLMPDEE